MTSSSFTSKRRIDTMSPMETRKILREVLCRCYFDIAGEIGVPVCTIQKVIRQHNNRLRRYQTTLECNSETDKNQTRPKRDTERL